MSARVWFWVAGLVVGVVASLAVPETLFPAARPVVFGAIFLLSGVLGESLASSRVRTTSSRSPGRDERPADGRVDVGRVASLRRVANSLDPRFGAFLGRDSTQRIVETLASDGRTSPPLLGRVVVVSLFVGREGRAWSDAEIAHAHRAMLRAGAWIESEAIRLGAPVNLELADTYFVFDDDAEDEVALGFAQEGQDVGPFELEGTTKALVTLTRAAARLGFHDAEDLFDTVNASVAADATVWLMHPRQAGRSFAVPREDSSFAGLSLAVCYARESSFPEPLTGPVKTDPVTVVHELLHLFGATDKYGRSLRDFAPRSVSRHDVMRLSETRLSRLRVDPFTAEEIGWRSKNNTAGVNP